ncbi:MAG: ion transporter [Gammaproteobacteria bacterium]
MFRESNINNVIRTSIERVLNDATLGFLALLSLFLLVTPYIFNLSPDKSKILNVTEYVIILIFMIEYLFGFYFAKDKRKFVFNLWRIIDALIIVVALIAILPTVPDVLRNSPALRLARLARIALLGTRSGIGLKFQSDGRDSQIELRQSEAQVFALDDNGSQFRKITWEEGLGRIGATTPDWVFIIVHRSVNESSGACLAGAFSIQRPPF